MMSGNPKTYGELAESEILPHWNRGEQRFAERFRDR